MRCLVPLVMGFLCLTPLALGAETSPDALPTGAVARLGWSHLRLGFAALAFAPDGKSIVAVTRHGNLRRFDVKTGRLLERRQLTERGDVNPLQFSQVQLSADGRTVALEESSYTGPRVTVYDVASGKNVFRRASGEKRHITLGGLSPDGKSLAIREEDNTTAPRLRLRLVDLSTGRMKDLGVFDRDTVTVHFSGDGRRMLITRSFSLDNRYSLRQIDLPSGKELWRRKVSAVDFAVSHDGNLVLASGYGDDKKTDSGFHVFQMNPTSGEVSERFESCRSGPQFAIGESPIDSTLRLAPDNRTVIIKHLREYCLWDLQNRKAIRKLPLPKNADALASYSPIVVSADSRLLLANAGYLQCWDLTTGKPLLGPPADEGLPDFPIQLAFTPDGKEIVGSSNRWFIGRWNVATGKPLDLRQGEYGGQPLVRTPNGVRTIRLEANPEVLQFTVLDPVADKTLHTIRGTVPKVIGFPASEAFTLTADGKTLLVIYQGHRSRHVSAWELASRRKRSDFSTDSGLSLVVSPFSPCGRWVLLNTKLYHVGSGTELFEPEGLPGERLDCGDLSHAWFSDDGRLMAASLATVADKGPTGHTLAVWELASGKILARFPKAGFVARVVFRPDDRTIAWLDAGGVRVEDLLRKKRLATYVTPDVVCDTDQTSMESQCLTFSPDGSTLASGHEDGAIVLWKVPPAREAEPAALADGEAEKLWKDLGRSSPAAARAAIERLLAHPDAAMVLLAARFRPPPAETKFDALIKDLDSDAFATREEAARQLRVAGAKVEPALRRTLAKAPSLEMRRRLEGLLAEMPPLVLRLPLTGEGLRGVRAIELLERIGNAAGRQRLQGWAEQTEDAQLAVEARLALERLCPAKPGP